MVDTTVSLRDVRGKMVFIGGLHRSGTTLLHRCISDHPDVSAFSNTGVPEDEGQFLQTLYPAAKEHGGPDRFGFAAAAHLTEESALATEENAQALLNEWAPHWDLSAACLVEKSPPNLIRMRFLQALFPTSRFIVLMHHPIAVSYATRKWSNTHLHNLIEHWLVCHERFRNDLPRIDYALVVRYEDFVQQPNEVLRKVYRFLELHHHPTPREATCISGGCSKMPARTFAKSWSVTYDRGGLEDPDGASSRLPTRSAAASPSARAT